LLVAGCLLLVRGLLVAGCYPLLSWRTEMTTAYRPRIAITRWEEVPGEDIGDYHRRVLEAGGEPLDLCVEFAVDRGLYCVDILAGATGLILTGGVDIDPALYGQALAHDMAILAICRGHQLLNVAFGGGLLQHIDGDGHRADYHSEGFPSRWHEVTVSEGSRLHAALGTTGARVNSRHHQAVTPERLAPHLQAVVRSPDGLIEGVESLANRWVVGVQWHPEREEMTEVMAPLFRELVRQASQMRARL
jgi:putative glutamine amidotransferase